MKQALNIPTLRRGIFLVRRDYVASRHGVNSTLTSRAAISYDETANIVLAGRDFDLSTDQVVEIARNEMNKDTGRG